VAQVVGISGKVITLSSNNNILNICKERVERWSPLARKMEWKKLESVTQPNLILNAFESGKELFHAIIYCGAIPELPRSLEKLLCIGGSLVAPVQVDGNQQFQLLIRRSATENEIRKISDFGVIFEQAK
jgi:protein-L-isoaspartate O-methyltransferase